MAGRAIWKGNIAFGLVPIPVALHSAEEPNELDFDLLDKRDLSPVGYERVNKRTRNTFHISDFQACDEEGALTCRNERQCPPGPLFTEREKGH